MALGKPEEEEEEGEEDAYWPLELINWDRDSGLEADWALGRKALMSCV